MQILTFAFEFVMSTDKTISMSKNNFFDVIIIGGSYAGLSAAMSLGRALRDVLVIDAGQPCNRQTPHSHNFFTRDGDKPSELAALGKQQVLKYETVRFVNDIAVKGEKHQNDFSITTANGDVYTASKLLFATGLKDELPDIKGVSECWGISALHCPYCHGYEVKHNKIGILGNAEVGYELGKLISNWTKDLKVYTNGPSTINEEGTAKLTQHNIPIIEKEISHLDHKNGHLERIVFKDGSSENVQAVFVRSVLTQHCEIPMQLGCELTEHGFLTVNGFQQTNVHGVFAAGDNTTMLRSVAAAVASGNKAGAVINKLLIDESF